MPKKPYHGFRSQDEALRNPSVDELMHVFEPLEVFSIAYLQRHLYVQEQHRLFEGQFHTSDETLKQEMADRNEVTVDGWIVRLLRTPRRRFDNKRFALEHPTANERYTVTGFSRQLMLISPDDPF